jgi:hypothetical protein
VCEFVQFSDGSVVLRWLTFLSSTAIYKSIEDAVTIHGHDGATDVFWHDDEASEPPTGTERPPGWTGDPVGRARNPGVIAATLRSPIGAELVARNMHVSCEEDFRIARERSLPGFTQHGWEAHLDQAQEVLGPIDWYPELLNGEELARVRASGGLIFGCLEHNGDIRLSCKECATAVREQVAQLPE